MHREQWRLWIRRQKIADISVSAMHAGSLFAGIFYFRSKYTKLTHFNFNIFHHTLNVDKCFLKNNVFDICVSSNNSAANTLEKYLVKLY